MDKSRSNNDSLATEARYLAIIVIALLVIAAASITTRLTLQHDGAFPKDDNIWNLTIHAEIQALESGAVIRLPPPWDTQYVKLFGQTLIHPGLKLSRKKKKSQTRDITFIAGATGRHSITAHFQLHQSHIPHQRTAKNTSIANVSERWIGESEGIKPSSRHAEKILETLSTDKPSQAVLTDRIINFVSSRIRLKRKGTDDGELALKHLKASALGTHRALISLLRAARVPARIITGVNLENLDQPAIHWVELNDGEKWVSVDIINGVRDTLPPSYVPLRKGSNEITIVDESEAILLNQHVTIDTIAPPNGMFITDEQSIFAIFDLTRMPLTSRITLGLLILLPVGVFLTEVLRQLFGIRTYGVFTPTLLALAMVYADWLTAILVFALVIVFGIIGRSLLPGLNLSRTPRLSVVFIFVAVTMIFVVSALTYFDPATDSSVVLLPIVILTSLVDRIYIVADKHGTIVALKRLFWTGVAASLSLLVLLNSHWGEFLLAYPELHAITLAGIIIMGPCRDWCMQKFAWFRAIQICGKNEIEK